MGGRFMTFCGKSRRRSIIGEVALTLLILLFLFAAGYGHLRALRTDRSAVTGIELLYGPSVMLALGRGYMEPALSEYPELRAFLRAEIESLPPNAVPEHIVENPSPVASYHRYLVYTVAFFWWFLGISWTSLEPLLALLFAWSGIAVYGIMRLVMRRSFAFVITLGFMVSPAMLGTLTELRDFSKAPFILSVVAALMYLVKYRTHFRHLMLWAVYLGVLAGIGMGFRQDIFVFLPLALAVLAVSAFRVDVPSRRWMRLAAVPVCLACFYATAWPMMRHMEGGAHPGHHLVQGFSTKRLDNLGMVPASYRPMASGLDHYIFSALYDHMQRLGKDKAGHFALDTHGSDRAGQQWLQDMVLRFPADLAARGYAAVWRNLRYADAYPPTFLEPTLWHRNLYAVHRGIASHLHQFGIFYGLTALCILAAYHPVSALGIYLFVLYVLGYIALQCEYRHAFHLSFFPFLILGFLLERFLSAAGFIKKHGLPEKKALWRALVRVGVVLSCGLLLLLPPLAVLRVYQARQVRPLLELGMQAPRTRVPVTEQHQHGWTLFAVNTQAHPTQRQDIKALSKLLAALLSPELRLWHVRGRYFVAEFKAEAGVEWVIQKYTSAIPLNDFSQLVRVQETADTGVIRYYFPVYELLMPYLDRDFLMGRNHFTGIALPDGQADAFLGLYEVEIPEELNLLMQCTQKDALPPDRLYQQIGFSPDPMLYYQSEKNATDNLNLAEAARRFGSREEALFFIRAQLVLSRQAETQLFLANRLLEEEAPEAALEAVLAISNESNDVIARKANLLEMIGRNLQLLKKTAQTEKAFNAAWSLDPAKEIPLRLELAILYDQEAQMEEALGQYRAVLRHSPDSEMGAMNADLLFTRQGAPGQRIAFWKDIAQARPEAVHPWLRLGAALEAAGDDAAAADAYATAFRRQPEMPEAAVRYAAFSVGALEPEVLRDILERALADAPDLTPLAVQGLVKSGSILMEQGRAGEALVAFTLAAEYDPENEWIQLKRAQALAATGKEDEAQKVFELLLAGAHGRDAAFGFQQLLRDTGREPLAYWQSLDAKFPGNEHVRFFLTQTGSHEGRALFASGRYAEAVRTLQEACPEPCATPEEAVLLHLARLAATGQEEHARSLRPLIQDNTPLEEQALSWMLSAVKHLASTGNAEHAQVMAQTAVDLLPGEEAGWLALIELHLNRKEYEAALQACRKALDAPIPADGVAGFMDDAFVYLNAPDKRLETWEQITAARPKDSVILLHLGLAFEATDKWRQAADTYATLLELGHASQNLRLRLGTALVRAGDSEEGTRLLLEAAAANEPLSPQLLQQAGNALLAAKQPEPAEHLYRKAAAIMPIDAYTRLRLGEALFQQGKHKDAVDAWKEAVLLEPDAPAAAQAARLINRQLVPEERLPWWRRLGESTKGALLVDAYRALALAWAGDTEQAKERLESISPHSVQAEQGMVNGLIACLAGDTASGIQEIREAALERPELLGDAANYLAEAGIARMKSDAFTQAKSLFRAATRLEPDNLLYRMYLGEALLELERYQEAIDEFLPILMAAPESPRSANLLDEAFQRKQDPEGRRRTWQTIVNAHPEAQLPRMRLQKAP